MKFCNSQLIRSRHVTYKIKRRICIYCQRDSCVILAKSLQWPGSASEIDARSPVSKGICTHTTSNHTFGISIAHKNDCRIAISTLDTEANELKWESVDSMIRRYHVDRIVLRKCLLLDRVNYWTACSARGHYWLTSTLRVIGAKIGISQDTLHDIADHVRTYRLRAYICI